MDKEHLTGADLIAALQSSPCRDIEIEPERYRRKMIVRNAVRCRGCGDIIESRSTDDFVTCSCGACAVDGGLNICDGSATKATCRN